MHFYWPAEGDIYSLIVSALVTVISSTELETLIFVSLQCPAVRYITTHNVFKLCFCLFFSLISSDLTRMTDSERDQIDQDAQIFMRTCSEAIKQLRNEGNRLF